MARLDSDTLSALLERALTLPPSERATYIDEVAAKDESLRGELASLLDAHEAEAGHFERLAEEIVGPALVAIADRIAAEFSPGQTICKYRLLEQLGAGGMGVVFKAIDLRLDRLVALKFLPAHSSTDPRAKQRIIAEAKAASALDHPHIGVVYDVDETVAGRLFIVMAYYEGDTIEQKLQRGRLPVGAALEVMKQIASALVAAHAKKIVHRDVKPSNILVTKDGTTKLLDFGIAKFANSKTTGDGLTPGTVTYMSPEQTRGRPVDHRTDLWSLGVVLYEMLTGVPPFRGDCHDALISAIRHDDWPRHDSLNGDVQQSTLRILERCLAKDPNGRYETAQDVLADLQTLTADRSSAPPGPVHQRRRWRVPLYGSIAALAVIIALVGVDIPRRPGDVPSARTGATVAGQTRLAVLPLARVGFGSDLTYLAAGMTDELIAGLSAIGGLRVIARSSVMQYEDSRKSAREIGRELSVSTLLEGGLRRMNDQIHITMRLVDAASQQALWTRNYTATIADLQGVQGDIVRQVADTLRINEQSPAGRQLAHAGTTSAEAYLLYLKGRHFLEKRSVDAAQQAKAFFEQALDLDPVFADAWAGLGDAYSGLASMAVVRTADGYARSRAAAERALQLNPDLAEAHVGLATALASYYWEFEAAEHHYRRALQLKPSSADAHRLFAEHLRFRGLFDEALREARQAEALDPLSPAPQIVAGTILYWARQYDQAILEYRRILHLSPGFGYAHFFLALAHIQKQEYQQAREALTVAGASSQLQQIMLTGYIDGITGREAEARHALATLAELSHAQNISPWHSAIVYLGLGYHGRAMDLLEQAYEARDWQLRMLPVEPLLDPLRSQPRFRTLLDKMQRPPRG